MMKEKRTIKSTRLFQRWRKLSPVSKETFIAYFFGYTSKVLTDEDLKSLEETLETIE